MTRDTQAPRFEIRPHKHDFDVLGVDEVVAWHPELVHLERMTNGAYWLGIDMPDGTHLRVWLHVSGLAPKEMRERDDRHLIHCGVEVENQPAASKATP